MLPRMMATTSLVVLMLGCLLASTAFAASMNGTVDTAGSGSITIKDDSGTLQKIEVDSAAKITLDGKTSKLDDLKAGMSVTVETEIKNDKTVAVMITGRSPQ
jgi:phosphate-selective porin